MSWCCGRGGMPREPELEVAAPRAGAAAAAAATSPALASVLAKMPKDIPRVSVFGSTTFHHEQSQALCALIGNLLFRRFGQDLVLLTGANAAPHEAVSRPFFDEVRRDDRVFHLHPRMRMHRCAFDFGTVMEAGSDGLERRAVLAQAAQACISVEGGPGTLDEIQKALAAGVPVVPLARTGGASRDVYDSATVRKPVGIDASHWALLGDEGADLGSTAEAVVEIIGGILRPSPAAAAASAVPAGERYPAAM